MFNKQQFPVFRSDPAASSLRIAKPGLYVLTSGSASVTWQLPAQSTFVRREREIFFVKNETASSILTITCQDGGTLFDGVSVTSLPIAAGNSAVIIADGSTYAVFLQRTTIVETSVPTTGTTFTMVDDNRDGGYWATPAGTIAALTVTLPSEANSRIGQRRFVGSSQIITTLTVNGATTIYGAPTTLAAGGGFTLTKVATNTWAVV